VGVLIALATHYEIRVEVLLPSVWSESVHLYPERSLRGESQKVHKIPVVCSLVESFPIEFSENAVSTHVHSEKGNESRSQAPTASQSQERRMMASGTTLTSCESAVRTLDGGTKHVPVTQILIVVTHIRSRRYQVARLDSCSILKQNMII
jgi:hypothetical protein